MATRIKAIVLSRVRMLLKEPTARIFNDTQINSWIDRGAVEFAALSMCAQFKEVIELTQSVVEYALATEFLGLKYVLFGTHTSGIDKPLKGLLRMKPQAIGHVQNETEVEPVQWYEYNKNVGVWPPPDSTAGGKAIFVCGARSLRGYEPVRTIVTSQNDVLKINYNSVGVTTVTLANGTYNMDELAAEAKTKIDATCSCTITVVYSATTRKFTFTHAANTLEYTHAASTAADLFGMNADALSQLNFVSDFAVAYPGSTDIPEAFQHYVEFFAVAMAKEKDKKVKQSAQFMSMFRNAAIFVRQDVWDRFIDSNDVFKVPDFIAPPGASK